MSFSSVFEFFIQHINTLILLYIAVLLSKEIQHRERFTKHAYNAWFRLLGRELRDTHNCVCSEEGACLSHHAAWVRWHNGATEAYEIAHEIWQQRPS